MIHTKTSGLRAAVVGVCIAARKEDGEHAANIAVVHRAGRFNEASLVVGGVRVTGTVPLVVQRGKCVDTARKSCRRPLGG